MKQTKWLLILGLIISIGSCKKVTVDFSYSPNLPKAGDTITFTNLSSGGEDYIWDFGDNSSAEVANPTHIYKQVGTYMVTLRESKSKKTISHSVTVVDSIPGFKVSKDSICIFSSVQLTASVWNPYAHKIAYSWELPEDVVLEKGKLTDASITVFFTRVHETEIALQVTKDGVTTRSTRTLKAYNTPACAVLMECQDGDKYYQRIYGTLAEDEHLVNYERGVELLEMAKDTLVWEDKVERKVYYGNENGLYVENLSGSNWVQISKEAVVAMTMSSTLGRLFFATNEGLYWMPLIHTENNQYQGEPVCINHLQIKKLTTDDEKR